MGSVRFVLRGVTASLAVQHQSATSVTLDQGLEK